MSVSDLQQNLTDKGYDVGVIDGKLGALTFQGLAEYVSGGVAPLGIGGLLALDTPNLLTQRLHFVHFFAQISHESGFKPQEENLNYSPQGLKTTFKSRISDAQCQQFGRTAQHPADKRSIANTVYGGAWGLKNLGNTQPGDGYLFRGRGLIQMTGRANYTALGAAYAINPDLLLTPAGSMRAAIQFWTQRKINVPAAADDVRAVTLLVNGGLNGLADRTALTNRIKAIWPA
jgi:putative chitinase